MSRFRVSTLRRIAWIVGLTSVVLMLASLAFMVADRDAVLPADLRFWDFSDLVNFVANLAVPLMGIVLATRRPRNAIGWLFTAAGLSLAFSSFSQTYALHALRVDPGSLPAPYLLAWFQNWTWPIAVTMLIFLLLLFPDGHLRSRRWRPVAWIAGVTGVGLVVGSLIGATVEWS
jgi:hypothetical protein